MLLPSNIYVTLRVMRVVKVKCRQDGKMQSSPNADGFASSAWQFIFTPNGGSHLFFCSLESNDCFATFKYNRIEKSNIFNSL